MKMDYPTFLGLSIRKALAFVESISIPGFEEAISGLRNRLKFLDTVGLHYLSLDRSYSSLSGGESQRVRLATQVGMGLVGVTYVLDEPTVGLHPANTRELLDSLVELRDRGNSVIVVEHDPDVMEAADHLVEIGPGAGEAGGRIIFQGTVEEAKKAGGSSTTHPGTSQ
jgi:excinuclease ABC subunit A